MFIFLACIHEHASGAIMKFKKKNIFLPNYQRFLQRAHVVIPTTPHQANRHATELSAIGYIDSEWRRKITSDFTKILIHCMLRQRTACQNLRFIFNFSQELNIQILKYFQGKTSKYKIIFFKGLFQELFWYFEERFFSYSILTSSHCVKVSLFVLISGPHFPAFGIDTKRYGVSPRNQCECGKMRTRITPNTDTFNVVSFLANL